MLPLQSSAEEIRKIVFPVDGEYTFSDSYGDPRSGGRTHLGTDIMAKKMTPIVSATDGYVSDLTQTEPAWGYAVSIKDSDNYEYRYLHINNDTPGTDDGAGGLAYAFAPTVKRGAKVTAGQLIGWVGDSGNAENVGSHLHFEIWTPNGEPMNSYSSLMAALHPGNFVTIFLFGRDLKLGSAGEDVMELQKYLNQAGFRVADSGAGSPGNETNYFGPATQTAVIKFQQAHGISLANGYFGSTTRVIINQSHAVQSGASSGIQPGWLIKNKKYSEVFFVDANMDLRWIISEAVAEKYFGPVWNRIIKEFDDFGSTSLQFGGNVE